MTHETIIVCNAAPACERSRRLFEQLPACRFIDRDDSGWDIGAFQAAALTSDADLLAFFGGNSYFRKRGWLARMWGSREQFGDTLYGCTGSQGNIPIGVHPHIRTTAFWCSPALMNSYPKRITQPGAGGERYHFEHGPESLTHWAWKQSGIEPRVVGLDGSFPITQCDSMPNGYHQGDQSNVLVGDRMTMPPFHGSP